MYLQKKSFVFLAHDNALEDWHCLAVPDLIANHSRCKIYLKLLS
jgi:hypothetical protein